VVGKTPRGTSAPDQTKLLDQLEAMVQDAVAVVPDDASVEILEASAKGASGDMYERLLMFCRSEVSIALLGQNQSTEASATNASATAGLEVATSLRDGDARLVEASINQMLRWVVDLNEGERATAPKFELFEQEELDLALAQRDQALTSAGVGFTRQYWMRAYDLEEGDLKPEGVELVGTLGETASDAPGVPASFAEGAAATQESITAGLALAGDGVLAGWMQQIGAMVNAADTREALRDRLLLAFGDLPTDKLTDVMAMAFALADLVGRAQVNEEV
jgi:phage gp29-like protein